MVFSVADLSLDAVRTLRVQGQVINGVTGQPMANANVVLVQTQQPGAGFRGAPTFFTFRSRSGNQGAFEIRRVVPGSYVLFAIVNERSGRMTARLPLEIGNSDVRNVSLIASPEFTLTGRIAVEGQQPGGAP